MSKISDERLAEMLSHYRSPAWVGGQDVVSVITELQALRSPHQGEVGAVRAKVVAALYGEGVEPGHPLEDMVDALISLARTTYAQPSVPKAGEMDAEALERENKALREALKPFAQASERYDLIWAEKTGEQEHPDGEDSDMVAYLGWLGDYVDMVPLAAFRAARSALVQP